MFMRHESFRAVAYWDTSISRMILGVVASMLSSFRIKELICAESCSRLDCSINFLYSVIIIFSILPK